MIFRTVILFLIGSSLAWATLVSCDNEEIVKTEINEVYAVQNSQDGYVAGRLLYRDSIVYQHTNLPKAKYVFDQENHIKGQEIYPVAQGLNIRSDYSDHENTLLSYYKYSLNDCYLKVKSEAFDASNDELLRVEEIGYDDKGQMDSRKIFTSVGQLATSYNFVYDKFGNEVLKVTQHLLRDTIITEESRITKYNDDKSWSEKWGFVDDKPVAFYKRQVKTH